MIGLLLAESNPLDHVVQHTVLDLGDPAVPFLYFPLFSNHILMQIVAAALLVYFIPRAVKARAGDDAIGRLVPTGFGNAIEAACVAIRDHIVRPNLGRYSDAFLPYILSVFFFIFTCNILGMIPLSNWFFFVPGHLIGGTSTGNVWVTGTFALTTLALIVYNGLTKHGLAYVKHFFMGPWWLCWFIAALEILGLGFKTIALCMRLFANMLGGHILLAVLLGFVQPTFESGAWGGGLLISIVVISASILINFLEILVAFLQAFIFTILTAVFIGQAVNIQHDEHGDEHAGEFAAQR